MYILYISFSKLSFSAAHLFWFKYAILITTHYYCHVVEGGPKIQKSRKSKNKKVYWQKTSQMYKKPELTNEQVRR